MTKWEYKVLKEGIGLKGFNADEIEEELNLWGDEGWEVIVATRTQGEFVIVLKRPASGSRRRETRDRWF